ncbi:5-carboxymethyl-2-hydroxymuconate isomerase [Ottowia thiooxydans]|uniref:5-carboxymethyl-2-hydroxymuconate isomerase n=1 Tax=Ottowia thiooxydans TaxID=219182 RepID=UPI0003FDF661|nr:5-carboxymethyl-2-hydroxymuconate isomerase [Ottowia thiooxydans]
MPHLVVLYTGNLDKLTDMSLLCRSLADAMLTVRDEAGAQVFPTGGTRVLAYPAPYYAVADGGAAGKAAGGDGDYAFIYLNLRMARGRSAATQQRAGEALLAAARECIDPIMKHQHIGLTVNVDEGAEVFDAKHSTLHPLFKKP